MSKPGSPILSAISITGNASSAPKEQTLIPGLRDVGITVERGQTIEVATNNKKVLGRK